jgi:hypothetical protein
MDSGFTQEIPLFEEGIRIDVLEAWYHQGLPKTMDHFDLFNYDHRIEIYPEVGPLPEPAHWPTDQKSLKAFIKRFDPDDPNRFPFDESDKRQLKEDSDTIRILRVHRGFFITAGVYEWDRFEEVMLLAMDDPGLVREVLNIQGTFAAQMAAKFLAVHKVEAALFSEPIGGNHGPLVSPKLYRDLILPTYQPIFEVLQENGVSTIIWRTYANTRALLPAAIDAGINCLWACECGTDAMDYGPIREEFGQNLRLIGGIDLDVLHGDLEGIKKEIFAKVPPLLAQGGYLPLLDGRVRKIVPLEKYKYYRQTLEELVN